MDGEVVIAVAAGVSGLCAGAFLMRLVCGRRISGLVKSLSERDAELQVERSARALERATGDRIIAEREKTVNEQIKTMLAQVGNLTASTLAEREKTLAEKNGEQVRALLAPMHQKLDEFRKAAEDSKKANGDLGVKIGEFFKGIKTTSESFGAEAKSFTDALRGANKKQGNWGEAILGQVLEDCGLKEGVGFFAQTGSGAGIPDYQVADPGTRKMLIIDSKMSWTRYEEAYRMPEGEERRKALQEHVASVKRHIDELKKADYPHTQLPPKPGYAYVPVTAMFVPSNAALEAALETEPGLVDYALKNDVALVSPLTLFGFLVLVSRSWSRYGIDRNSERIYEEAKKLVTYVDRTFRYLEDLGRHLGEAKAKFDDVMGLMALEPSGQCIKGPANAIIRLSERDATTLRSKTLTASE